MLKNVDAEHKKFLLDVVCGCAEYDKILHIVVDGFYNRDGRYCSSSDRSQFLGKMNKPGGFFIPVVQKAALTSRFMVLSAVICYLITFVLDELGLEVFSSIIRSQDKKKMLSVRGKRSVYCC